MAKLVGVALLASLVAALCLPLLSGHAQGAATPPAGGNATTPVQAAGILVGGQGCYALHLDYAGHGEQPSATPGHSWSCTLGHYVPGEVVVMTARPGEGAVVAGWTGTDDDGSIGASGILTMPADDHVVTVIYDTPQARLWLPLLMR
ncbi:MAG: InlB B-repeat-containing protein [Anaerolineae bacterium]